MLFGPFKIYYIEYDENGQEIGRGVYPKEYKDLGWAYNIARKHYGDRNRFKYSVAQRDPWVEYSRKSVCPICGKTYDRPESVNGNDRGMYISFRNRGKIACTDPENATLLTCPECFEKVHNYVDSLIVRTEEK